MFSSTMSLKINYVFLFCYQCIYFFEMTMNPHPKAISCARNFLTFLVANIISIENFHNLFETIWLLLINYLIFHRVKHFGDNGLFIDVFFK